MIHNRTGGIIDPLRAPTLAPLLLAGCWAAALLSLPTCTSGQTVPGSQLPVAARTHTFASYLTDPVLEPLVPVFASTVKVVRSYADDAIAALGSGSILECSSSALDGAPSFCSIVVVYQSLRRADAYRSLGTGPRADPYFSLKWESGVTRLLVSMVALKETYENLSVNGAEATAAQAGWKTPGGARAQKGVVDPITDADALYFDPDYSDGVRPYAAGLTEAEIRREQNQEAKALLKDQRLRRRQERDAKHYDIWVRKQLGIGRKGAGNYTMSVTDVEKYYINPINKRYPRKWVTDESGSFVAGGNSGISSSYIYDYAIIIQLADGTRTRLDMTIVPLVYRYADPVNAYLCRPGAFDDPSAVTPLVASYIPRAAPCAAHTARPAPYAVASTDYATLHPEEAAWLPQRLSKTAASVQQFVAAKLTGRSLDPTEARLRVAVANTGGGKRAMLHSMGVSKALHDMGVLDHASWNAGISGGSWYVTAHYLASFQKTDALADPAAVMDAIKGQVQYSMYGDYFQGNQILTDILWTPVLYESRIPNVKNITRQILCESELKLQSPLASSDRSASGLDYWNRAITTQLLPADLAEGRGLDITMSSLASSPLLANHAAALPMFQIQENLGDGSDTALFRLWEVSPFDMAVMDGALRASYPTSLLGSDPSDTNTCAVNLDNIGYLEGICSWAFGGFPAPVNDWLCGKNDRGFTMCQAASLKNLFRGFAGVQSLANDLYTKKDIYVTDGGLNINDPVWSFLTPTRQADIIFSVDGGGASKGLSGTFFPTLSSDTTNAGTCPVDLPTQGKCSDGKTWLSATTCCRECAGGMASAGIFGCFSVNDAQKGNLGASLSGYRDRMPANTAPPYPTTAAEDLKLGERVVIFGCDTVSTKTPIVNIPNRAVLSGHSGHDTLKGCVNLRAPGSLFREEQQYVLSNVEAIFANGAASLPSKPGLPDFSKCVACLYYAKAKADDAFSACPATRRTAFRQGGMVTKEAILRHAAYCISVSESVC